MNSHSYSNPTIQLGVMERVDLCLKLLATSFCLLYNLFTGVFRGKSGAKKYRTHVGHAMIRHIATHLTTKQIHYVNLTTGQSYEVFAKSNGILPETVEMKYEALGHWIGDKNASKILIYYHGGGFQLSAPTAYFEFFLCQIESLPFKTEQLAVFCLNYTLTPYATYPSQLRQAVEALRYIHLQYSPSRILLGGDSAGGNLVLGVLSHLSHSHPEIEELTIEEPLAGAFLVSPWVSFSGHGQSAHENRYKDLVTIEGGRQWSKAYLNGRLSDNWSEPGLASASWWKDAKVQDVLILAGSDEILLTSIVDFVEKFQKEIPNTKFFVTENEGHVAAVLNRLIGETENTQQERLLLEWLDGICG